jgi:hypothetical protein
MKKLILCAVLCIGFSSHSALAQGTVGITADEAKECNSCNRLILGRLDRVVQNTQSSTADSAALRAEVAQLRAQITTLTEAVRSQRRTAVTVEGIPYNVGVISGVGLPAAEKVADAFCSSIGYPDGMLIRVAEKNGVLPASFVQAALCYDDGR